uniref:Putative secreted peptide n=1 Tax=Anopheles braziliensis TaxID=58242 RepID=A0A2M3ZWT3_9DIPT
MMVMMVAVMLRLLFGRHYSHTAPAGRIAPPPPLERPLHHLRLPEQNCFENATILAPGQFRSSEGADKVPEVNGRYR